ncbi:MAG: pyridoxal phosphate-dependent aminotransferase [Firmicutes bacterium]|nr:pyridoxal phosphate-dependent aminotransferase [Candidatus Fermentithermobacillaceae bacterium]
MKISERARAIGASPTLALDARTKELQKQGVDVVNFGVGEPDFDTPDHIKEAAIQAIRQGFTKYTPSSGIPELREACARKFREENGLDYKPDQILISVGAKHSIYNAIMVLCEPGDEALIPVPYWVSYPEMVKLAGAKPVYIQTTAETGFKVTPEMLSRAITPRTRVLILNSPSNPTGAVYTRKELSDIAEICLKHGIWVISDEIYEKLIYEGEHVSFASLSPELLNITITVNGVSKAYAMTGWRIGYAGGPKEVIKAMGDLQSHATSNPTSISQKAALAALTGPTEPLERMRQEFKKRRDYIVERAAKMPGFRCQIPNGAFYIYPDVSGLIGKSLGARVITSSSVLAEILLEKARIAVVPGEAFGTSANLRFSYATSMERIKEGMDRLEAVLREVR